MAPAKIIPTNPTAEASFIATWEEAMALHRALPTLRRKLKASYKVDNFQMAFRNPWGGPNHTEFSLLVELAKGATGATAAVLTKWLLDAGKDFLEEYRAKTKKPKGVSENHRRPRVAKRNRR